jgi:hypothetical protein
VSHVAEFRAHSNFVCVRWNSWKHFESLSSQVTLRAAREIETHCWLPGKISACNWVKSLLAAGGSVWKSRARDARCTPKAEHVAARLAQRIDRAHCKIHSSECKKCMHFPFHYIVANTDHVVVDGHAAMLFMNLN